MTKIKMDFQNYSVRKPSLELSCIVWTEHYNFLLGLPFNTKEEDVWFREQILFNRLYDV